MPRKNREKSVTGIYHVMLRGINRQDIFEDDEDYRRFITILRSTVAPRQLCLKGVKLRQLSRITGISYGTINRAKSGS